MTRQRSYKELVDDHRGLLHYSKKLGIASGCLQFSLLILINSWQNLELPYYKIGAPLIFAYFKNSLAY
jgi:hypothetical protein